MRKHRHLKGVSEHPAEHCRLPDCLRHWKETRPSGKIPGMKTSWSIGDSIDLEYFSTLDQDISYHELQERDRRIVEGIPSVTREKALFAWLRARRREADGLVPGETFLAVLATLRLVLIVLGLLIGFAAGWGFFTYLGRTPVNVLYFFALFILPQWLFVLLALLALLPGRGLGLYPPLQLAGALLRRFYAAASAKLLARLDAEKRLRLSSFAGQSRVSGGRLKMVLCWLAAALTQGFACAANVGLLLSSLMKIAVTDLAFGWQSTLDFSAEKLFASARFLAWPWSWLWPEGVGHPNLAQIGGSRIVLKEGIARLQTEDLVSWWPFLLLCLLVYGLLPRLLLWAFCRWREHRALAHAMARMPEAEELWRRMRSPLVSTDGLPDLGGAVSVTIAPTDSPRPKKAFPTRPAMLAVPEELLSGLPHEAMSAWLAAVGLRLVAMRSLPDEYGARLDFPAAIAKELGGLDAGVALCLLAESWLPPIAGFLELLRRLRAAIGERRPIIIALIGKSKNEALLSAPDDPVMLTVWRQKLAALADANLRILPFDSEES
ncbi:MAG: DUF2868 domain-containing protein [Desulfobulbaceae bacterium]|nr:DUF2868 domain-containing protein [Desulfobulbaceae bacterium]